MAGKSIVFTIGRFNPPSIGHEKLINKVIDLARSLHADERIYPTTSVDAVKNPLPFTDKVSYMKKLFPQANITKNVSGQQIFQILKQLYKEKYENVYMVVGDDRVEEFDATIKKYNNDPRSKRFNPENDYFFKHLEVVSAGERNADDDGVSGASGTKMRSYAAANDFKDYSAGTPGHDDALKKKIFNSVRKGMRVEMFTPTSSPLTEGVYDKNIFKLVFIGGAPGSGKDYVLQKVLSSFGLIEINSDIAFENRMLKAGLSFKMPDNEKASRDSLRDGSKATTNSKMKLAIAGRLGLIINSVAADFDKISNQKALFESLGYDTAMVFVQVTNEVSKQRNELRGNLGGRTVPEPIRQDKYDEANQAVKKYDKLFSNFYIIDNSTSGGSSFADAYKKISRWISTPIRNEIANQWIQSEKNKKDRTMKNINEEFEDFLNEGPIAGAEAAAVYKAATPGQETAKNVPYSDEEIDISDDIKKIMDMVRKRLTGQEIKESVVRWALKEKTLLEFIDAFDGEAINELEKTCIDLSGRSGKRLSEIYSSTVNPDELIEEGSTEHSKYQDHTKNPFHKVLSSHGFVHKKTEHKNNFLAKNNPKADYTEHLYMHPDHGKSSVSVEQNHDGTKSFVKRHQQSNGIMAPSRGDTKGQLDRSLTREYGPAKN